MENCREIREHLFEHLDGALAAGDERAFVRHLDLCRPCFQRVEFERALRAYLRTKTDHPCPAALKDRIRAFLDDA